MQRGPSEIKKTATGVAPCLLIGNSPSQHGLALAGAVRWLSHLSEKFGARQMPGWKKNVERTGEVNLHNPRLFAALTSGPGLVRFSVISTRKT